MNFISLIYKRINLFKRKLIQIIYVIQYFFENVSNLVVCIVRIRYRIGNNVYSNIFFFVKESYFNVVLQWWVFRGCYGSYFVFVQGYIKVFMSLYYVFSRYDGFDM